jgi:hypothetical protein
MQDTPRPLQQARHPGTRARASALPAYRKGALLALVLVASGQIAFVCPVGLPASGFRQAAADHVANTDDRDVEPGARCGERVNIGVSVAVAFVSVVRRAMPPERGEVRLLRRASVAITSPVPSVCGLGPGPVSSVTYLTVFGHNGIRPVSHARGDSQAPQGQGFSSLRCRRVWERRLRRHGVERAQESLLT